MGTMVGLITGLVRYLKPVEHPMTQRQGVLQQCKQCLSFGTPQGNAAMRYGIDIQLIELGKCRSC